MNETHTLDGIEYVSRLITKEEDERITRNREGGCSRCELGCTVGSDDYGLKITGDGMRTTLEDKHLNVQISYCLFCGVAL